MLDQAENQYKNLHFHIPLWDLREGFMKAYTISTKPSSSARENRKNFKPFSIEQIAFNL